MPDQDDGAEAAERLGDQRDLAGGGGVDLGAGRHVEADAVRVGGVVAAGDAARDRRAEPAAGRRAVLAEVGRVGIDGGGDVGRAAAAAALGGAVTGVPWPGWVSTLLEMRLASLTIGIRSSWFSRTARSGPRPFHEASAVTETP